MHKETQCLHAGYTPGNGQPRVLPINQSTTFTYDSSEEIGKLFDLKASGFFYSRLSNPTVDAVEQKITALEGGVGTLCTASGQAAIFTAIMAFLKAGDSFIAAANLYGGSINLFGVTLKKMGINCIFVNPDDDLETLEKAFTPDVKAVYAETLANPSMAVLDFEKFAKLAHSHKVPFLVDNTLATPHLCTPIAFGADIVIHSTTKYLDGHAVVLGGAIVDSGNFDWAASGKFPDFTEPDESYHGTVYTRDFGKAAYILKARLQIMRDVGAALAANSAFLLNLGIETLPLRMERHCQNALAAAEFLAKSPKVESVSYPGLKSSPYNALAEKYLPKGTSGVLSFVIKGGKENAIAFMDRLKLVSNAVHVADIRTCILHPASSTHRQLTEEQLKASGIETGMMRLSVGLEHIDDILADLAQALA